MALPTIKWCIESKAYSIFIHEKVSSCQCQWLFYRANSQDNAKSSLEESVYNVFTLLNNEA